MGHPLSKRKIQLITLVIFSIVTVFVWITVLRVDRRGELTVAFLDVGQGDAIYIEAPNGNQVLIDGGPPSGKVLRALGAVMPSFDRSLDVVFATHPDQDHVGGLPSVLDRYSVDYVATTENTSSTGAYGAFEEQAQDEQAEHILARAGERIILDDGVVLEILFPDRSALGWETNTASVIAQLSYGDTIFLFTGDAPQSIEKYLTERIPLHSDVLKLGHHGSRTSSAKEFLSAVDPSYVVISAGEGNTYGHPHKEVLGLLDELGISVVSTIDRGSVVFKTDGTNVYLK